MTTLTSPTSTITTGAKGLSRNLRILIFLGAGGGFGALFDAHSLDVPYFPVIALLLLPFFLIVPRTGREGFGEGFLFGLSANLVGVRWVTVSMEEYGHIPPPLALGGLALFSLYLALYPALFRALSYRLGFWEPVSGFLRPRSLWMGPSLWIVCDAGKDEVLTGFPWNPPGSLLFAHPLLALPARIVGTTGLSFLILLETALLAFALSRLPREDGVARKGLWLLLPVGLLSLWLLWGSALERGTDRSPSLPVALIQGNIPPDLKWSRATLRETLSRYLALSRQGTGEGARLLVWPETALPVVYNGPRTRLAPLLAGTLSPPGSTDALLLTGAIGERPDPDSPVGLSFTNSAVLYSPGGQVVAAYNKRHLVPFGEFLPLPALFGWLRPMTGITGDMAAGHRSVLFPLQGSAGGAAPLICYEALYPSLSRTNLGQGTLLAVISDDAWFGNTSAPWQLFRESGMRAAENGVYLVRAANTGLSGIVAPDTTVPAIGPLFRQAVVTGNVRLETGQTFYRRHGEWVLRLSLSSLLFAAAILPLLGKPRPSLTGSPP
uniref:Apolipoprotein N-acyltransferase n=1 Tax=Leptospirillum ferrodiazotrophum TaxID=412449 RepID=C6HYB2_9BACT|nr:MAG: apolipoprotein N-acyltransferase [Leptospirillum ferrodiazotrophum]